ncbi:predicted protein [Uncinocarpus reesii 1704]|uniref:Uncharacterized protein n=1 Tax=Uncinocarpus reesii (strain UAMH 1704) TaxID=336963 RepID=C4JVW9_UNCRE|nr:uncharacterized protein UREG_06711 [Uncinocarpus reesii 1704]EEP81846.1 predicted protein [Uncinocarpus reesii 1704]
MCLSVCCQSRWAWRPLSERSLAAIDHVGIRNGFCGNSGPCTTLKPCFLSGATVLPFSSSLLLFLPSGWIRTPAFWFLETISGSSRCALYVPAAIASTGILLRLLCLRRKDTDVEPFSNCDETKMPVVMSPRFDAAAAAASTARTWHPGASDIGLCLSRES